MKQKNEIKTHAHLEEVIKNILLMVLVGTFKDTNKIRGGIY